MAINNKTATKTIIPARHDQFSYDYAQLNAVRAVANGEASPEQQKLFMQWLVRDMCMRDCVAFRHDSDRATAFAQGRQFVGIVLSDMLKNDNYYKDFNNG